MLGGIPDLLLLMKLVDILIIAPIKLRAAQVVVPFFYMKSNGDDLAQIFAFLIIKFYFSLILN